MKKISLAFLMTFISIAMSAQKDVTKFMGIPVDGFKSEMKQKLISKGFTPTKESGQNILEGEFNGTDVYLHIVTNNNKVYRIMVADANTQDEPNIKIRFNKLVSQFSNNKRYMGFKDYIIPEDEDISYEMLVHKKIYEASYYQVLDPEKIDTLEMQEKVHEELLSRFTAEEIENRTEDVQAAAAKIAIDLASNLLFKKPVWFRICEDYGKYYIAIFYDNEYNHANGEDL